MEPVHLEVEAEGGGWRLACGEDVLERAGLEADVRESTTVHADVTCPGCRAATAELRILPPHFAVRLPVAADELARAIRRVCRPHWIVDTRLGRVGLVACDPRDADALIAHYRVEWAQDNDPPDVEVVVRA